MGALSFVTIIAVILGGVWLFLRLRYGKSDRLTRQQKEYLRTAYKEMRNNSLATITLVEKGYPSVDWVLREGMSKGISPEDLAKQVEWGTCDNCQFMQGQECHADVSNGGNPTPLPDNRSCRHWKSPDDVGE
jgi:hypothetical protein